MAPSKVKPDDLIEAFSDSKVIQALSGAILPLIKQSIREIITEQLDQFNLRYSEVKKEQEKQLQNIRDLESENRELRKRVDVLDCESRATSLVIRGLPETSYAEKLTGEGVENVSCAHVTESRTPSAPSHAVSTERSVILLCNEDLGLNISAKDIELVYRMRSNRPDSHRPVHVRFTSRKVRDAVFDRRRLLKGKREGKIFISENLTKSASELFFEARKLQRERQIYGCWTAGGAVFVKRLETDKPLLVRDTTALRSVLK